MSAPLLRPASRAGRETLLTALALAHGGLLLVWPTMWIIAMALWWNANTISHNFIHRPFFRTRAINTAFSCYLSLLLGFPQSLWRARHLAHHFARHPDHRLEHDGARGRRGLRFESLDFVAALALWGALLVFAPRFVITVYLPGYLCGLGLCALQGRYEHIRGTVSHYGRLYNILFFNDGYHVEHHAHPGMNWRELRREWEVEESSSRYPAVIRWLEHVNLCALERLVLRLPVLQRFVIDRHERAFRVLIAKLPPDHGMSRVGIVGGGLFPRTAIILRRLPPQWRLTLIDLSAENLDIARRFVASDVEYVNKRFDPAEPCDFDLLIIPLSLVGARRLIYRQPPAPVVLAHDWIWRPRGTSVVVSWLLLKRLNLVVR
jgi:fatty acid desaturase